jgi:hypothetical protein
MRYMPCYMNYKLNDEDRPSSTKSAHLHHRSNLQNATAPHTKHTAMMGSDADCLTNFREKLIISASSELITLICIGLKTLLHFRLVGCKSLRIKTRTWQVPSQAMLLEGPSTTIILITSCHLFSTKGFFWQVA